MLSLNELPEEILIHIFDQLGKYSIVELMSNIPYVRRQWNIIFNKLFFKEIKCIPTIYTLKYNIQLTNKKVISLVKKCPRITHVDFCLSENLTDAVLYALAENCPKITYINFYHLYLNLITDAGVIALTNKCSRITFANFSGCYRITDMALISLADNCQSINHVSFPNCFGLTDTGIIALANKCLSITHVCFANCHKLTNEAVYTLSLIHI